MNLLVVPKPLFNSEMDVEGYYFSYQYGNAILEATKSNPLDGAMHSPFIDFMNVVGLEALTQNTLIFIPVTQILLMTELNMVCREEPEKIVFLLEKDIALDEITILRVQRFSQMGYKFAFHLPSEPAKLTPFLPFANFLLISMASGKLPLPPTVLINQYSKNTLVATDIADRPSFDSIKYSGIQLFDGPFYKVHISSTYRQNALSPLKVNYIQLLNIVNQDDFSFDAFTQIVRQDTALAIQFMRLVNSSSRINAEIKNITQAAALLGQREIKKWVSTAVSTALCTDRPSEITRLSLLRAKFCENMARHFEMAMLKDNLFLMGLMSVLDIILEIPMADALNLVFLPEPIKQALMNGQSDYSRVLNFIQLYEHGDWREISRLALMMNISISDIHDAYVDAMLWYSNLISLSFMEK